MTVTNDKMKNTIAPSDLLDEDSEISLHIQTCANAIDSAMSSLDEARNTLEVFLNEAVKGGMTYEQAEEKYFSVISDLVDEAIHKLWG